MTAGELVYSYRLKKGISQAELSAVSGVAPATISDIEHGADPRWENFKKLAIALSITIEDLMGTEVTS